jgi:hypothetical protein
MAPSDLVLLRTALLITLSILLVFVLLRRFRRSVLARDTPAAQHVQVERLNVAYHPPRLFVVVTVPKEQAITTRVLDGEHRSVHDPQVKDLEAGTHTVVLDLPVLLDGVYFLEVTTDTQRTVRQFRLLQG